MKLSIEFILNKMFEPFPESTLKYRIRRFYLIFWCSLCKSLRKSFRVFHPFAPSFFKDYLREYIPGEGDVVIDGGAFEGGFTLIASLLVGDKGNVIAFEPDAESFRKLTGEIKRYQSKNVIALNKGLWSKNTTLKFLERHASTSSFLFDESDVPGHHIKEVPVVRLDDELKKMRATRINFIKLDVEGAEIEVIRGAEEILKNNDVNLAIASYHVVEGEKSYIKLEKILSELGYRVKTTAGRAPHTYGCRRC